MIKVSSLLLIGLVILPIQASAEQPPSAMVDQPTSIPRSSADIEELPEWNEQRAEEWRVAKEQILAIRNSDIPARQKCEQAWQIAWPLAKSGNLEARYTIFNAFRENGPLGYKGDALYTISLASMSTYLYYHSLGAPSLSMEITQTLGLIHANAQLLNSFPQFKSIYNGYAYFKACVINNPSQACLVKMLEQRAIPAFNRVAEEMDMIFSAGLNEPCINTNNPHMNSLLSRPMPLSND